MTTLTHDEINNIIDLAKPHAKVVCDRIYNRVKGQIGGNETFKTTLDNSFDIICNIQIEYFKKEFDAFFTDEDDSITVVEIADFLSKYECFMLEYREKSKPLDINDTIVDTIDKSVAQAFTEKLAEYLNIDISEVINGGK